MGVNSLPKTVTQQRRGCDWNPGLSAPESSTLTTRLPSHPKVTCTLSLYKLRQSAEHSIYHCHNFITEGTAIDYKTYC